MDGLNRGHCGSTERTTKLQDVMKDCSALDLCRMYGRFPLAMRWISEGRIDLSPLVTHRFELRDIQKAFETFRDKTDGALKVVVRFPSAR